MDPCFKVDKSKRYKKLQIKQQQLMNLTAKTRKKVSFTPIMLTSKSIRPLDRSDFQIIQNQRKFSQAKHSRQEISNCMFKLSTGFSNSTTYGASLPKEQLQNARRSVRDVIEDDGYKRLIRKMTNPAVVRVQFQQELVKTRKKIVKKNRETVQMEDQASQFENKNKYSYLVNAKTFDQFTKIIKMHPQRRNMHLVKNQSQQEWGKYLQNYHLSIKKVQPILKRQFQFSESLFNKNIARPDLESTQNNEKQKLEEEGNQRYGMSPNRSNEKIQISIHKSVYIRIQRDINAHRLSTHKKDYFVFGLSEGFIKNNQMTVKNKFDTYRDFIFRVNFTNGLYVKPREQAQKPYKFYVGPGNNSAIIKGMMSRRFWWQQVQKITQDTNFVWSQLKISLFFKRQNRNKTKTRINRLNHQLDKQQEFSSNISIQEEQEPSPEKNSLMYGQDLKIWQKYLKKNKKCQQKGYDYSLMRRLGGLLKKKTIIFIQNSSKLKIHNHLQSNYYLGNKKALFYSLRKYYQLIQQNPFNKIPITFHITEGIQDPQFQHFLQQFINQNEKRKTDKQFRNIWIIKPGQFTNRGRGITVCSTLDEIKNRLKSKERNGNGTNRTFILQKYIEKPLLYQRRKFDIRHYMAITCTNGKIKGYWYDQGYIRTTSSEYNIKNTKDLFTHLTNDAIQKYGQDYGRYEKGNKISYTQFQKYLSQHVSNEVDFQNDIIPKMKGLATDSMRATYAMLDQERRQHNFQLFGLDFMLDQNLNVYLIEVNTNPCLQTSCPLLNKIITPLIQNLFKLCLDPLFPPPYQWPNQKKYNLGQNALQQNKFNLVFDESQQGPSLIDLYKNTTRIDNKMGDIFEQDEEYKDQQKQWVDQQECLK